MRDRKKKLDKKETVIEYQLEENPKLKKLVLMNGLYELIHKCNDLIDEHRQTSFLYTDKVETFNSKIEHLPYY